MFADFYAGFAGEDIIRSVTRNSFYSMERSKIRFASVTIEKISRLYPLYLFPDGLPIRELQWLFLQKNTDGQIKYAVSNAPKISPFQNTDGDRVIVMQEGDSVHLWTDIKKQEITNIGRQRAIALWVGTL